MAESSAQNYIDTVSQALIDRKDWLERAEISKLKDDLRLFQISFSVLYNMFLKKKLINEDPYKQESRISELEIPESGPFNEIKKTEQISIRMSSFDNQLDFLVNFYQFGVDFLNLERIRKILGLIRYIDWVNFTPDSPSDNTRVMAEITNASKANCDHITLSMIGESLTKLTKSTSTIMGILRNLTVYHKETYKIKVRNAIKNMSPSEVNANNIRKKMSSEIPGVPFYLEFIDEIIKEDYSKDGQALREKVLKLLEIPQDKPKIVKPKVDYKSILMSGIQAIGTAASVSGEIARKCDDNEEILASQKKGFMYKIKMLIKAIFRSEPEPAIYELQYIDQIKGTHVRENLNYTRFRADYDKKIKILIGMNGQGPLLSKLGAMEEEQIIQYLERNIKDLQSLYKTLSALDEFFKSSVPKIERVKIKGIKPELAAIKNCIVKANHFRHQYSAQKEEEEQLKRLGISSGA